MKLNQLRTAWIVVTIFFFTAISSLRCIYRSYFGNPTRAWADNIIHQWVERLLTSVQVKYKVVNPHQVQPELGKATILMCNHSSAYDIPLSFKAFPQHSIRMLAKKELAKIPLLGRGMKAIEFPFIDRKNRYQAIKDLEYAKKLMESGIVIWVAPEGTRSKDGSLGTFKKGSFITAIQSNATIIPIGIRGANNILPARTFNIHLNQEAEIHIGKPIDASQFTVERRGELIEQVREEIKQLIGKK